jgi:hypothetical protein
MHAVERDVRIVIPESPDPDPVTFSVIDHNRRHRLHHDLPRSGNLPTPLQNAREEPLSRSFRNGCTQDLCPEEAALRPLDDLLVD